ncbi:hypothetical protein [Bacillus marasmi]|uniref:hypothetical protein n=1 Tax=Bacillus marasmi TaxID=1926279 RepID=UPI003CCC4EA5
MNFLARELHFTDHELVLKLSGTVSLLALKRELRIPYQCIKRVYVEHYKPPLWMLRIPGTSVAFLNIYEGTFYYEKEWYFFSFEHYVPLIHLELSGHKKYKYVIFELEKTREALIEIRSKLREI